jgi:hypothetical protein
MYSNFKFGRGALGFLGTDGDICRETYNNQYWAPHEAVPDWTYNLECQDTIDQFKRSQTIENIEMRCKYEDRD